MARLAFIIVVLHLSVVGFGWVQHHMGHTAYDPLFFGAFLHVSPVMVIFNLLSMLGSDYGGRFSTLVPVGLALAVVKYGALIFAIRRDGFSVLNMLTVALEAGYVAASGYYLTQLNLI